jgi:thioesterase III
MVGKRGILRPMLGSIHEYQIVIKEHHLDVFGHVNHAVYLELFEEARWELVTQNGYGYAEVVEKRIGPAILEANLVFKRELRNRQQVRIQSWMESHEQRVGRMGQRMLGQDDTVHCEAMFKFGLMDLNKRRLIEPTPEWWRAMGLPVPGPT